MHQGFSNFQYYARILCRIFIAGILMLLLTRLLFLFVYGDLKELRGFGTDLLNSFITGARFDIKVLTFAFLPLALFAIGQIFDRKSQVNNRIYYKIFLIYSFVIFSVFILISIIDFNFYSFFNTRISVILFGIIDDDTKSIIKAIWTDYPVVFDVLLLVFVSVLLYFLLRRIISRTSKGTNVKSIWSGSLLILLFTGLYFIGLRGSLGLIPLDIRHSGISGNTFINTLTLNGMFALKTAFQDKKNSRINTDIPGMLKHYGFRTPEEAVTGYLGNSNIDTAELSGNLLSRTPVNPVLADNPPNVVFVLMESMNGYYLDLHSPEMNLMGKLEDQLPDCYVFRNFVSGGKLTIFSLEALLVGTPLAPISQSVYQNRSLSSSVAVPFKEKGYATSFLSAGDLSWRSVDKFIFHQKFDQIEGRSALNKLYPEAYNSEWGIHDEYLFDRVLQVLKKSEGVPQFIFALTISNHTPYDIPGSYSPRRIEPDKKLIPKLKVTPELAIKNLQTYQYANNCLGQFIEDIRKSSLGENTIIIATGDHTNRSLFNFPDRELLKNYSVPLILYVPEKYKPENTVNTSQFGSHKDIFPTIYNLALSDASYLKTGINLLGEDSGENFGIYNFSLAMNSYGCVDLSNGPIFYKWEKDAQGSLEAVSVSKNNELAHLMIKALAYDASMSYYIMKLLSSGN